MKPISIRSLGLTASTILLGLSSGVIADAQVVVQSMEFNHTVSYDVESSTFDHVDSAFFAATFDPFNSSLGELLSFEISWNISNTATGTIEDGGSVILSFSGPLTADGITYDNGGTGKSQGGPPGTMLSLSVPFMHDATFNVADANVSYDPRLLAAMTGEDSFTVSYQTPISYSVSATGSVVFDATTAGSVTLTYNYTPAAVPEPSTYAAIVGALALGGTLWRRRVRCS